jgi:hypothetical protein
MKKGISLITLIITIVVILILAGIIILTLANTDLFKGARKAIFINDVASFVDELEMYKAGQYASKLGEYEPNSLQGDEGTLRYTGQPNTEEERAKTMYTAIPTLKDIKKYAGKFVIKDGKLVYLGKLDDDENDWADEIGVPTEEIKEPEIILVQTGPSPIEQGEDIEYTAFFSSQVSIVDIDLEDKLAVVDKNNNEVEVNEDNISIGTITGTNTQKQALLKVNSTGMSQGEYRLVVKSNSVTIQNNVKNTSDVIALSPVEIIDVVPPEAPEIEAVPSTPTNGNVTLTITYSNDTKEKLYSFSGDDGSWLTYNNNSILITENNTIIYAKGIDDAGNESILTSKLINNIDREPPVDPVITVTPATPTNTNVVVTISCLEITALKKYSLDNGATWITYTTPITITDNKVILAKAIDEASNESTVVNKSINNIDKIAPTVAFGTNGGTVMNASSTVTVSDTGGSNISSCEYVWTTSTIEPNSGWTTFTNGQTLTTSLNGTYYLWIKATDNAGNVTTINSNAFYIDNTAPVAPTISLSTTSWTNLNVIATIGYSADTSNKQYSTNGTTWLTYTSPITITSNSTVYARAYDEMGNASTFSATISNIDKTLPANATISVSSSGAQITGTITASDSQSGISLTNSKYIITTQSTAYTVDNSVWSSATVINTSPKSISISKADGYYYVQVLSVDNAGNKKVNVSNQVHVQNLIYTSTTIYFSGTSQSQSQTAYLANLASVASISTNNGGASYSTSGNNVYVNVYSGSGTSSSSTSSQYATTTVGPQTSSSFPSTKYYTSGSYSGNLSYNGYSTSTVSTPTTTQVWNSTLYSRSASTCITKNVTTTGYPASWPPGPSSTYYSASDGYAGTLYLYDSYIWNNGAPTTTYPNGWDIAFMWYSGTIYKGGYESKTTYTNTTQYTGNYSGYIYYTSYYTYYPYTVTIYYYKYP